MKKLKDQIHELLKINLPDDTSITEIENLTDSILQRFQGFLKDKRQDLIELITCGGTPDSQATRWLTVAVLDELLREEFS